MAAFLQRLIRWGFVEPRAAWFALGGSVALPLLAWLPGWGGGELRVRVAGYAITLLGVGLVALQVSDTRELFGRPSFRTRLVAWLGRGRHVVVPLKPISAVLHASMPGMRISASGTVHPMAVSRSTKARLDALEKNVARVEALVTTSAEQVRREIAESGEALRRQQTAHNERIEMLAARLESVAVSSLDWTVVGAAWIIAGQWCTTFPAETANFFARLLG